MSSRKVISNIFEVIEYIRIRIHLCKRFYIRLLDSLVPLYQPHNRNVPIHDDHMDDTKFDTYILVLNNTLLVDTC